MAVEINPFSEETAPTSMQELQEELAMLDRRRYYILTLLGEAQRSEGGQMTFTEELDGQDDD